MSSVTDNITKTAADCLDSLARNKMDIPAAAIYIVDTKHTGTANLVSSVGMMDESSSFSFPTELPLSISSNDDVWRTSLLTTTRRFHTIDDLIGKFGTIVQVNGRACERAHVLPLMALGKEEILGVLIVLHNPLAAPNDAAYISFLETSARTIVNGLSIAKTLSEQRLQAEELRRLSEAKTTFFSNISHEFRTPLTLMKGPLDDVLERFALAPEVHQHLTLVRRNARRLEKLVNELLKLSRIDSGHQRPSFELVDIATLTADIAGMFRVACEKANLIFTVDCKHVPSVTFVDVNMWEQIVSNLLSNAYKFTLRGSITLRIAGLADGTAVELMVSDTGCGIPTVELPLLFQRFHRVASSSGRTHEGTGIGLALAFELVRLHGGLIRAESDLNVGTTFTVRIPTGSTHLPIEHLSLPRTANVDSLRSAEFSRMDWLLDGETFTVGNNNNNTAAASDFCRGKILVVDDNSDMLSYIARILQANNFAVLAVCNSAAALSILHSPKNESLPSIELVLSDIMMPGIDGLALLRLIRTNSITKELPVILLSARAGEEARLDGLEAGADDYLVKPFTTRELLARVVGRIDLHRARLDASRRELILREQAERANSTKDRFLAVLSHELRTPLTPALMLAEQMHIDTTLPPAVQADCGVIAHSLLLETQLIDDLLDVSKVAQQKLCLQLTPLAVHAVLREAVKLVQYSADEKSQKLSVDLSATQDAVFADSARLQQIFWNLLKNAIKFTPECGFIAVRTFNSTATTGAQKLVITITDTGIGIEASLLPKLFKAFEQGGESTTREYGGLGLGLCISKSLAEMHHGTLTATSKGKGCGATFMLELPINSGALAQRESTVEEIGSSKPPPLILSLRVLLVEDNKVTLLVMCRLLLRLGCIVQSATTLREAAEKLREHQFDVLLSDMNLPDGSGLALLDIARRTRPTIVGIAVTGNGAAEDIARSLAAGYARHLTKPIRLHSLEAAIAAVSRELA